MKKVIIFILIFVLIFGFNVSAQTETQDFLKEQAQLIGANELEQALPDDTQNFFEKIGITPENGEWVNDFGIKKVFTLLLELVKKELSAPFNCGLLIIAIILVNGVFFVTENGNSAKTANLAVTAACAAVITAPLLSVINTAVTVLQSVADFMTVFVPVFASVIALNGKAVTSVSMSSLLLGASQTVELVANHFVIPLMCGYLCISVVSGVSPLLAGNYLGDAVKKVSFWVMSLMTTVFIGILSIQTAVNASADSLATKTAKFIIGSSVPLAGTVLSEALTTVTASLGILKTSVAVYGVVACSVIFLPVLINLLLWRITLNLTGFIADALGSNISKLLRSIDTTVAVLCGIILLSGAMFIISLTVVVSAGKTV